MVDANMAEAIGRLTTGVTRYLVTIGIDEVSGRMTEVKALPDGRPLSAAEFTTPELSSLDSVPLGQSLGSLFPDEAEGSTTVPPESLFAGVVGLEYERAVLRHCLGGEWTPRKHALIYGPPGSAKSFLLEQIRSLPNTRYVTEFSRAEIRRIVSEQMNGEGVLLVDEIEKADRDAQDALLVIMDGNLAPAIHGQSDERHVEIRVIGAANYPERLTAPLRSRFHLLALPEYPLEQRKAVMTKILEQREGITPEMAAEIAGLVAPHSADVRTAERIAEARVSDPELATQMAERLGTPSK